VLSPALASGWAALVLEKVHGIWPDAYDLESDSKQYPDCSPKECGVLSDYARLSCRVLANFRLGFVFPRHLTTRVVAEGGQLTRSLPFTQMKLQRSLQRF